VNPKEKGKLDRKIQTPKSKSLALGQKKAQGDQARNLRYANLGKKRSTKQQTRKDSPNVDTSNTNRGPNPDRTPGKESPNAKIRDPRSSGKKKRGSQLLQKRANKKSHLARTKVRKTGRRTIASPTKKANTPPQTKTTANTEDTTTKSHPEDKTKGPTTRSLMTLRSSSSGRGAQGPFVDTTPLARPSNTKMSQEKGPKSQERIRREKKPSGLHGPTAPDLKQKEQAEKEKDSVKKQSRGLSSPAGPRDERRHASPIWLGASRSTDSVWKVLGCDLADKKLKKFPAPPPKNQA